LLRQMSQLFVSAGLQAIIAGAIPIGIGLLALGGITGIGAGVVEGLDLGDNTFTDKLFGDDKDIEKFATGGFVKKPTLAMVGEQEPEYIIPQSKMRGMFSSPTIVQNTYMIQHNTIQGSVMSEKQLAGTVTKHQARMMRGY